MYCKKCGAELPQDAVFCPQCGISVGEGKAPRENFKKNLYRSSRNKMISGVCGGIAEYFGIDPTLVRLGLVLLTALGGAGVLAYIVLAIVVPSDDV